MSVLHVTTATFQPPPASASFPQRNVVNMNFINDVWNYAFINHVLEGDNVVSPVGAAFVGINPSWPEMLDQTTGYPNHANANNQHVTTEVQRS